MTTRLLEWLLYVAECEYQGGNQNDLSLMIDEATTEPDDILFTDPLIKSYSMTDVIKPLSEEPVNSLIAKAEALLTVRQVEQRTEQWYNEMKVLLTASELGTLFITPRARGQLVLSKASSDPPATRAAPIPVDSSLMSPFDWGIRFENVIKQLYEWKHADTKVHDVGRMYHPTLERCAASPDGIVLGSGAKAGRLIEIKCPVTRDIGLEIPQEYFAQMQQQLEVCDLEECDYVEAKLRAPYSSPAPSSFKGPALASGIILRVEKTDDEHRTTSQYIYGEVNGGEPDVPDGWHIIERVPWDLLGWHLVTVKRNREWWSGALERIRSFWADVELAKAGAFQLPGVARAATRVRAREEPDADTPMFVKRPRPN
jgi:hypothetical protein